MTDCSSIKSKQFIKEALFSKPNPTSFEESLTIENSRICETCKHYAFVRWEEKWEGLIAGDPPWRGRTCNEWEPISAERKIVVVGRHTKTGLLKALEALKEDE